MSEIELGIEELSLLERFVVAFEKIAEALEASAVTQSNIAQESIRTMQATQDMLGKDKGPF